MATSRRGMGWLLVEVIPVFVWAQVTGALLSESFYLVTYLTLLGAEPQTLALLPLVAYGGNALSTLLVFGRHRLGHASDPKRRCVVDTTYGRVFWLGTIIWPFIGLQLDWSASTLIAGVLVSIFFAQLAHAAGGASFSAWTQAVVAREHRGRFWVWRNLISYAAVAATVLIMGLLLPQGAQATAAHLPWLMGIFLFVTLACLASSWALAKSPDVPVHIQAVSRPPLRAALTACPGYWRLTAFNACSMAAMAISMAYLPALLQNRGVGTAAFAACQGSAFVPAMLAGIFLAGWGLGRIGGARLLQANAVALLLTDLSFLLLSDVTWLAPCLLLSGLAKGMWSIALIGRSQELAPEGDNRFPALMTGLGASAAVMIALGLRAAVPQLTAAGVRDLPWFLMAIAAFFRLLALVSLLPIDRRRA